MISVKDTILSYGGAQDPISGRVWGGVMANSGSATGNFGNEKSGVYFNLGFQYLTGQSVETNPRIDGTAGTYWRLARTSVGSLNAGVNLFAMHYAKNLRFFTMGHGGYFSPQSFYLFSVPVTWTGKAKRLEYLIATSVGSQSFTEDASPYFPMDPLVSGEDRAILPEIVDAPVSNYNLNLSRVSGCGELVPGWLSERKQREVLLPAIGRRFDPILVPSADRWRRIFRFLPFRTGVDVSRSDLQ